MGDVTSWLRAPALKCFHGGEVDTVAALKAKYVLLFFGATWSPHFRTVVGRLAEWYANSTSTERANTEVVYVSSDRDQRSFDALLTSGTTPWPCIPFERSDVRSELIRKFRIVGLPSVVLVDPKGVELSRNAALLLEEGTLCIRDADGTPPWNRLSVKLFDILLSGTTLLTNKKSAGTPTTENSCSKEGQRNPYFAILLGASWNTACRDIIHKLVTVQKHLHAANGTPLNIIYLAYDREKESHDDFCQSFASTSLYFLPVGDDRIRHVRVRYGVTTIPRVILFDVNGEVVKEDATHNVLHDPCAAFPYVEPKIPIVAVLNAGFFLHHRDQLLEALNFNIGVLLILSWNHNTSHKTKKKCNVLSEQEMQVYTLEVANVADGFHDADRRVQFCVFAGGDGEEQDFCDYVLNHVGCGGQITSVPALVAVNISNNKAVKTLFGESILTADRMSEFVHAFVSSQRKNT